MGGKGAPTSIPLCPQAQPPSAAPPLQTRPSSLALGGNVGNAFHGRPLMYCNIAGCCWVVGLASYHTPLPISDHRLSRCATHTRPPVGRPFLCQQEYQSVLTMVAIAWGKKKLGGRKGFERAWALADKLRAPVNTEPSNKLGAEAFWPTTLDKVRNRCIPCPTVGHLGNLTNW
jgi:hypothetical protein